MTADKPFRKSFACSGVLFTFIIFILLVSGVQLSAYRVGYILSGFCFFPGLGTGIWAALSKKSWNWARFAATVIGFAFISFILSSQRGGQAPHP